MSAENEPQSPELSYTESLEGSLLPPQRGVKSSSSPKLTLLPTRQRPPKRPALNTANACKLELGKIYRMGRAGLMPLENVAKLTYVLTSIVKIIDSADIERRLKALEQDEDLHEHQ